MVSVSSPARPAAARPLARSAISGRIAASEVAIVGGFVLLAGLVRWPDYLYVPVFTDEAREIVRSATIAQGKAFPLVNVATYIGPLYNYVLAALFILFGPQIFLPRLVMLVAGSLTVGAAYLLGREWGGRPAGLAATALLATSSVHILVNSHVAWSNCLTPLFTTLALWQLSRAVQRRKATALAWCGLLFGLALLTHPAPVVLVPGCAVYLLWRAPGLLRSRWLWIGALVVVLLCSPLLIYNLTTGFDSLRNVEESRADHALGRALGPDLYLANEAGFALLLLRTVAGTIDAQASAADHLRDPVVLGWLGLGLAALALLARRGNPLPLLLVGSSLLVAPLWSVNRFEPVTNGRYLMPAAIGVLAAVGCLAGGLCAAAARSRARPLWLAALGLVGLAIVVQPLVELVRYYDSRPPDNRTSINALGQIEAARAPGEMVIVDRHLNDRRLSETGTELDRVLAMLLTVRNVPFDEIDVTPDELQSRLVAGRGLLAVLDGGTVDLLKSRYSLTLLAEITPRMNRNDRWRDAVPSWRDLPISPLLRRLDPQSAPEQRSNRLCTDCPDPGVYRIGLKG